MSRRKNEFWREQRLPTFTQQQRRRDFSDRPCPAHPTDRRDDSGKVIFKHIVGCMKTAGYMWTDEHKHCQDAPVATNPLCYLPDGTFARTITTAQVAFE